MAQQYNYLILNKKVCTSVTEMQTFLSNCRANTSLHERVINLSKKFIDRFDAINQSSSIVIGKNSNPFVLSAFARMQGMTNISELDQSIASAKIISSLETALGRIVEDVVPSSYGWSQVHSTSHSTYSEIDSSKLDQTNSIVFLAALKSGPSCINDSMVSQIANAISTNWEEWADYWKVNHVHYIVGMNYSTGGKSNKKDWHIIRLAEEKLSLNGTHIINSCIKQNLINGDTKPQALKQFEASANGKRLTVKALQGREFWAIVGGGQPDVFFEICAALALAIGSSSKSNAPIHPTILGLKNVILRADQLTSGFLEEGGLQWFVLLVSHFVDEIK